MKININKLHTLKIATRQSELALWQANYVKDELLKIYPNLKIELITMLSKGDKLLDSPLSKIGGKGLFIKELEHAILSDKADIAVHSIKDIPTVFTNNLGLNCICKRDDPRDAFVSNKYAQISDLPNNAIVGTSSLRRSAQLLAHYPNLQIKWLRGNVNTRLTKLDNEEYDAIILAASGLKRLELEYRIKQYLSSNICLSAIGQGAVGIECLNDSKWVEFLKPLHHEETAICITTERAINKHLNGGCQVPIAGFAHLVNEQKLHLTGLVASVDGKKILQAQAYDLPQNAVNLGIKVAEDLLQQGADIILKQINL